MNYRLNRLLALVSFLIIAVFCLQAVSSELLDSDNDGVPDGFKIKSLKSKVTIQKNGFEDQNCLEISSLGDNGFSRIYFPVPEIINSSDKTEYYLLVFRAKLSAGAEVKGNVKTAEGESFASQLMKFMVWKDKAVSDWYNVRVPIELKPGDSVKKIYANISFSSTKGKVLIGSEYFTKINEKRFKAIGNPRSWEIITEKDVTPEMLKGLKKGNIIRNSSFELGSTGYSYTQPIYRRINNNDSVDGKSSLSFKKAGLETGMVESLYYRICPGKLYTFSAYVKGDKPDTRLSIKALSGYQWSKGIGGLAVDRPGAILRLKVGTEWKRFHFSFIAEYAPKSCCKIIIAGKEFQLDAIQLEEGLLTDYKPDKTFDIGINRDLDCFDAIYKKGEKIGFNIEIDSFDKISNKIPVKYTISDYWGNEVLSQEKTLDLAGKRKILRKTYLTPPEPGVYKLRVEATNLKDGVKVVSEERSFGILPNGIAPEPNESSSFGIHVFYGRELPIAKKTGFGWNRTAASFNFSKWSKIEPKKGEFVFNDWGVDLVRKNGLQMFATLDHPPKWALTKKGKIKDINDFKNYVFKTVSHYKGKVKYWEVFNEPYYRFSSQEYAELLKAAYGEIKRADPDAKVVGICGYLIPGYYMEWIEGILKETGTDYMDIISTHAYLPNHPELSEPSYTKRLEMFRGLLKKYGKKEVPIWDTESTAMCKSFYNDRLFGADTALNRQCFDFNPSYKSGCEWIARQRIIGLANGVKLSFYYGMQTIGAYSHRYITPTQWLMEYTYSPHPVLMAHAVLASEIDGAEYIGQVSLGEKARGYIFVKNSTPLAAVWRVSKRDESTTDTVILNGDVSNLALVNMMGGKYRNVVKRDENRIELLISGEPVYIKAPGMAIEKFKNLIESAKIIPSEKLKANAFAFRLDDDSGKLIVKVRNITSEKQNAIVKIISKPESWKIAEKTTVNEMKPSAVETVEIPIENMKGKGVVKVVVCDSTGKAYSELELTPRKCLVAKEVSKKIKMDGFFEDWPKCEELKINERNQVKEGLKKWDGEKDLSASVSVCYDTENLYLAVKVKDEKLLVEGMGASGRKTHTLYASDCVELFFEPYIMNAIKQEIYQLPFAPASKEQKLPAAYSAFHRNKIQGIEIVSTEKPDGYDLELKIPFAVFNKIELKKGSIIGFDVTVNDRDTKKGRRQSVAVWQGSGLNYCDSSKYGVLLLD